jgi:hypothetical protein
VLQGLHGKKKRCESSQQLCEELNRNQEVTPLFVAVRYEISRAGVKYDNNFHLLSVYSTFRYEEFCYSCGSDVEQITPGHTGEGGKTAWETLIKFYSGGSQIVASQSGNNIVV